MDGDLKMSASDFGNKYHTEIYDREYFEGSSAMLFIGDVFVDEIVSYEYSVQEQRVPLRSYASRYREAMTNGIVEVNGTFSLNYKESGYLWAILKRYRERMGKPYLVRDTNTTKGLSSGRSKEFAQPDSIGPLAARDSAFAHEVMRANIETLTGQWDKQTNQIKGINNEDLTAFAHSIAGFLTKGTPPGEPFDPEAENIFEIYENMLWGSTDQSGHPGVVDYSADPRQSGPEDTSPRKATDPHWQGFEIWITCGDFSNSDLKNHTVRKLIDVHLLGSQQSADPSGNNIIETYMFSAMDLL